MDQSIKTLISLVVTFIGVVLLISCASFFLKAANARSTLYSVIEYVEVYGYDAKTINSYAKKSDTKISVTPIETGNKKYRYEVKVSFKYSIAFIDLNKDITLSGYTRFVSY